MEEVETMTRQIKRRIFTRVAALTFDQIPGLPASRREKRAMAREYGKRAFRLHQGLDHPIYGKKDQLGLLEYVKQAGEAVINGEE